MVEEDAEKIVLTNEVERRLYNPLLSLTTWFIFQLIKIEDLIKSKPNPKLEGVRPQRPW
jgi:hypothetical protein